MLKKLLIAVLLTTCYLPLNAIQLDPKVVDFIDEFIQTARCNVLLEMIDESNNQERLEHIKTELLIELRYLRYWIEEIMQRWTQSIHQNNDPKFNETIKKRIDNGVEALESLKNLEACFK
jgi:hypothetical protein